MQPAKNAFLLSALHMFPAPFPFQDSFLTIAKHLRLVNRCGYIFHKPAQCLFRRRNRFLRNTFGQPAENAAFFSVICSVSALHCCVRYKWQILLSAASRSTTRNCFSTRLSTDLATSPLDTPSYCAISRRRIASAVVACQKKKHQQFVRREMIFLHLILKVFPVCFLYLKIIFKKVLQHVPPPFRRFMPSLCFS